MLGRHRTSSYQLLKLVEEAGQIGVWSVDLRTGEPFCSEGLSRITGLPPERSVAGLLDDLRHPDDRHVHLGLLDRLCSGRAIDCTYRIVRPDRTVRWVSVKAQIVLGDGGRPSTAEGVAFDVTAPHEARMLAEQCQARYRGLIDAIAAVVWTTAPGGQPRPSASWQALTGQPLATLTEGQWLEAVHPDDRLLAGEAWRRALEQGDSMNVDYRIRCADGATRWFNSRAAALRSPDGVIREWIGVLLGLSDDARDRASGEQPLAELTGPLARSARALLDWSIGDLSRMSGISASSIKRFEEGRGNAARASTRRALRQAFESAGIAFIRDASGRVCLRTPPEHHG